MEKTAAQMIDDYIKVRDRKQEMEREHKEKVAKLTRVMDRIENELKSKLDEDGGESFKTSNGTAYVQVRTSAKVADRETFLDWVQNAEAWDFLESRVSKSAVEGYLDEHGDLPPGVDISRQRVVNINRPSK